MGNRLGDFTFKYLTTKEFTFYGILGSIGTYAFGGWTEMLSLLCWFIVIDYATGIIASLKEGKGLNSSVGGFGLAKKGLILLVIFMAHRIDITLDINYVMDGAIYFYLANELISIVENYGRIGFPLPPVIKRVIAVLKDKEPKEENKTDNA